jgi:hypothetical protein
VAQNNGIANDLHAHATYFSKYLREALLCIETAKEQLIPTPLVKAMIATMSVILNKIENAHGYNTVGQTLTTIQNDLKTTITMVKTAAETVQTTAMTVQRTATASQQTILRSQDTNAITKECKEEPNTATPRSRAEPHGRDQQLEQHQDTAGHG